MGLLDIEKRKNQAGLLGYENSGLYRFVDTPSYRPAPYAPQNFLPPQLAPLRLGAAGGAGNGGGATSGGLLGPSQPIDTGGEGGSTAPPGTTTDANGHTTANLGPTNAPVGMSPQGLLGLVSNAVMGFANSQNQTAADAANATNNVQGMVDALNADPTQGQNDADGGSSSAPGPGGASGVGSGDPSGTGDAAGIGTGDSTSTSSDGGGGGGKIICTAMNDLYGLPYRENKVWLAYAAQRLTPAHQRGYHKVFMPLVRYAYKSGNGWSNRALRAALVWIAVERTKDLQDEIAGRNPRPIKRALLRRPAERLLAFLGRV